MIKLSLSLFAGNYPLEYTLQLPHSPNFLLKLFHPSLVPRPTPPSSSRLQYENLFQEREPENEANS